MALHAVLNLGPAFLTVGLYHLLVRWLVARLGVVDDRSPLQRLDAARRSLGLIAFLIFASGEELDHMQVHQDHHSDIREAAITFGPLVLAVGVYKLGVYLAGRRINRTTEAELAEGVTPPPVVSTI
jgi:hypothetical protein